MDAGLQGGNDSHEIWMIIRSFHPIVGGAERQALFLSQWLQKLGWRVHVVTRRHIQQYSFSGLAQEVVRDVRVHRIYSRGVGPLGVALYLLGGLSLIRRSHSPNSVYYAHSVGSPAWLGVAARLLLGGRTIVKMRFGAGTWEEVMQSPWQRVTTRWLLRIADVLVAVSQETRQLLEGEGVARQRIVVVPNGVDSEMFRPADSSEKATLCQRLGLPKERIIALCVGRLVPVKGIDLLIRACATLPSQVLREFHLVIVGDGPQREALESMARNRGMHEYLSFVGHQENTRDYYRSADFFVLPSRSEGLSNALVEAMSCGLPSICSAVGGALDWIQDGVNGLLFPADDIGQLRSAILEMMMLESRWREMGHASRQLVEQELDLSVTSSRLSALLCK